ncbi:translocation/assembly module TamB domain-containing protein [Shimia sp. R11_0]|uniref:translocation/assembly module TamB domain-containing protein n=1 Tax=Shimia sp. R11_0 TaxID=2821096 RepID=UPI001ADAE315|nr:translocation/assembly module TamB domain-containing protein [Shimia sp. R11_0]MBO9475960.1 translocation/assembly module TamB domain-containing protein [Shimia sp. R11_0]
MRWLFILLLSFLPLHAFAQEAEEASDEDKGMLTRFLEDSLSGAGREVEVVGLRGAISSNATLESLRISDSEGLWLTLNGVTLNWNRLAVLRGNINVNELSAEEIILARAPKSEPAPTTAEAKPFALPELPVSINIQSLKAERISLGESLLGEPVDLSLTARLILEGGTGEALLSAARLNGPAGRFALDGAYANETEELRIDLQVHEDPGGLVATLAKLPGAPEVGLTVLGAGPLEDFTADLRLTTEGEERLGGEIVLSTEPGATADAAQTQVIRADISGNMAPLFAPDYKDFFGESIALNTLLRRFDDGRTTLENLALTSSALNLRGALALTPENLPASFDLDIDLRAADGDAVLLPVGGPKKYITSAALNAEFDAAAGDAWSLTGDITGIDSNALKLDQLALKGSGTITTAPKERITAALALDMDGLVMSDATLANTLGDTGSFVADILWEEDAGIKISGLTLQAAQMTATGDAHITGTGADMVIATQADLDVPDLAAFAGLANRAIAGALSASLTGDIAPLKGGFDLTLRATGQDLAIDDPRADPLLAGPSSLDISAKRDENGLTLRKGEVTSAALRLSGAGTLASQDSDLTFETTLDDIARVLDIDGIRGPVTVSGSATQTGSDWAFDVAATAPAESSAKIQASLPATGDPSADLTLDIGRVQALLPSLPGAAHVEASVTQTPAGINLRFDATGPFDTSSTGRGVIDPTGTGNDLTLSGSLPLAAANLILSPNSVQGLARYDLRVQGALAPENVTGTVSFNDTRFAMPDLRIALEDIGGTVNLANNAAQIAVTSRFSGGGDIGVNGSINLAAPFSANLPITLRDIQYQQGQLFKTELDGDITLTGPLTGGGTIAGDIRVGRTDVSVTPVALSGAGPVPDINHINETAAIRTTRDRAGLIAREKSSNSSAPPFNLDVTIDIQERIALRGLGLNADFNGGMRITGTTNAVSPNGELDLIRGRLDFLAKTFEIDEGRISMLGDFVPTMRVVAISEQPDATIYVILDGPLDDPQILLESDPELPEDEVLSQLLFGRDLSSISALQAAQLAGALATLSGQGPSGPRLGENSGLDDLGLTFDESGTPGLRAGKYINENVYTEIGVDSTGRSSISLNLDVTDNLTIKGKVGSDDDNGIGLFFQRDY